MERVIITIARQYGSGGKTIGHMLADDLRISCYDREILKLASEDSGINEELFMKADEKLKSSRLFRAASKVYSGELIPPDSDDFVSNDNLFNYQAKVIKELAAEESCVVIGRAADFILKDYDNVVSVFVHASGEACLQNAMERNSMSEREMERYIAKTDRFRAEYYRHYTGRNWDNPRNYDLCLDSSKLSFAKCVEVIKAYIDIRF